MEHRTGSSQDGLSNLQRKVLKNTFVNNSNNLRLREDSRSKQVSSDWLSRGESKPVEMSGIAQGLPGFSLSQSVSRLFGEMGSREQGTGRVEVDLAARLQDTLLRAEAGSVILLPPERISVSTLRVCNPLTLKGSPGTVLEVTNGSIVIDFSSHSKESLVGRATDRVEICELSILYRADRHCLDSKAPVALFVVDSPYSFLEVRDCDIRSVSQETGDVSGSSGPYMVQDVCLWVNGLSNKKTQSSDKGLCSAFMTSCNVTGFHEFVKGGANCKIHVERCHISDCSSNAFALLNPKEVLIQQSVIERCQASSIDIRLKNAPGSKLPSRSGSLTTSQEAGVRSITITGNDIRANGAYGVTIWSEHQAVALLSVVVSRNKIVNCRKEGVAVRHLTLSELSIQSNDFSANQGTGCWLQKVYKLYADSSITLRSNRSFDSHSGYGIYLYDTAGLLEGNECYQNSCKCYLVGGLMIVGSSNKDSEALPQDLLISNSSIYSNGENGITVLDFAKGTVTIEHCKVYENAHSGLYLLQSQEPLLKGEVLIRHCDVQRNRQYGVTLSMIKCCVSETTISENQEGAVSLDERSKQLLTFTSQDSEQVRSRVQGTIGGDWGSLYPEKRGFCGRSNCQVF